MSNETEIQAAADIAAVALGVRHVQDNPFVVVPAGYQINDLERMLPVPTRKRGNVTLRDTASFIRYVVEEASPDSRIYGSYNPPSFKAVFNDTRLHPAWRDHTATYSCPVSKEWQTWTASNGKSMTQEAFAQFIEDNLPDIAQPPAADMLEISRTLEAKKKVNFASGVRLANGETELTYEEQISGTAAKGKLTVPETFTIGIPVLEGGAAYAVTARLRYRIGEGGKMAMWYDLVRPHKILEDAIKEVWTQIQNQTGVEIFNGTL